MKQLTILHIVNREFSLDTIDQILKNCLPGSYKIVWHTKKSIWEMCLKYNGKDWQDLS